MSSAYLPSTPRRRGLRGLVAGVDDFMNWLMYGEETWLVAVLKAVPLFFFMYFLLFYIPNYVYYAITLYIPFLQFSKDVGFLVANLVGGGNFTAIIVMIIWAQAARGRHGFFWSLIRYLVFLQYAATLLVLQPFMVFNLGGGIADPARLHAAGDRAGRHHRRAGRGHARLHVARVHARQPAPGGGGRGRQRGAAGPRLAERISRSLVGHLALSAVVLALAGGLVAWELSTPCPPGGPLAVWFLRRGPAVRRRGGGAGGGPVRGRAERGAGLDQRPATQARGRCPGGARLVPARRRPGPARRPLAVIHPRLGPPLAWPRDHPDRRSAARPPRARRRASTGTAWT